jgi:outer membrane protein assembly factor BamB
MRVLVLKRTKMVKKALVITLSLLLLAMVGYLILHFQGLKQYSPNAYLTAIPSQTPIVIVTNDVAESLNKINKVDSLLSELTWIKPVDDLKQLIKTLQTNNWLSAENLSAVNGPMAVTLNIEAGKMGYAFYYGFFDVQSEKKAAKQLRSNKLGIHVEEIEEDIFRMTIPGDQNLLYATVSNGVFIASNSKTSIVQSLAQLGKSENLLSNQGFLAAQKTVSKEALANIFLNLNRIDTLCSQIVKTPVEFSKWGSWAALDIDINPGNIGTTGILSPNVTLKNAPSELFNLVTPSPSHLLGSLPIQTVMATVYNFGENAQNTQQSIHQYINKGDSLAQPDSLISIIQSEVALALLRYDSITDKLLIFETASHSQSLELLKKYVATNESGAFKPDSYFEPGPNSQIPVYNGFDNQQLSQAVRFIFNNAPDRYFTIFGNQVVFADSIAPLTRYLQQKVLDRTLENTPIYSSYIKSFPANANLHFYLSPQYLPEVFNRIGIAEVATKVDNATMNLQNFFGFGLQLACDGNTVFVSQNALFTPNREEEPTTIWQSKLDSSVVMKPLMVYNAKTEEKEFLVQDQSHMLYLISSSGIVQWSRKIDAPIIGDIQTIDFFGNKKTQFAFSAGDAIYVIDYNGNNVGQFPVRVPSPITNPVAVFDYEKNGDYRFTVACQNNSVMVFNKQGNRLPDWSFTSTESTVQSPVQHFSADGKDFIVVTDQNRFYFLDRKGKTRFEATSLPKPIASFVGRTENDNSQLLVTLSETGELIKLSLPGGKVQKTKTEIIPNGKATIKVVDGNYLQYLIKDNTKLCLIDQDGNTKWVKSFPEGIIGSPDLYNFGKAGKKIGLSTNLQKIYLFNLDGSICNGFPLIGISRFSIGYTSPKNENLSLVVGGKNHFLYNYDVKVK